MIAHGPRPQWVASARVLRPVPVGARHTRDATLAACTAACASGGSCQYSATRKQACTPATGTTSSARPRSLSSKSRTRAAATAARPSPSAAAAAAAPSPPAAGMCRPAMMPRRSMADGYSACGRGAEEEEGDHVLVSGAQPQPAARRAPRRALAPSPAAQQRTMLTSRVTRMSGKRQRAAYCCGHLAASASAASSSATTPTDTSTAQASMVPPMTPAHRMAASIAATTLRVPRSCRAHSCASTSSNGGGGGGSGTGWWLECAGIIALDPACWPEVWGVCVEGCSMRGCTGEVREAMAE